MRKFYTLLAGAAALTLAGGAVQAQTAAAAPAIAVGAKVSDASGGAVGTVTSVADGVAVVDTGTTKAGVPVGSFAARDDGVAIAMTKAELESAASGAKAEAQTEIKAKLVAGTAVKGPEGLPVGTIKSVDGQYAEIDTGKTKAKLPLSAFAANDSGVVVSMSKAQIEEAAGAAAPAASKADDTDADAPK